MTPRRLQLAGLPTDLLLVDAVVTITIAGFLLFDLPRSVEWPLAVLFVLVLPGYVLVAAMFPTSPNVRWLFAVRPNTDSPLGRPYGPGWALRVAMSLLGSLLVVSIVGILLSAFGVFRLTPVVIGIGGITFAGSMVAWVRRRRVPPDWRADPAAGGTPSAISRTLGLSGIQTVTFGIAVLMLVGSLAFFAVTPSPGTPYSEATLVASGDGETFFGENESVTFVAGEGNTLHVSLGNHEGRPITYTLVGQIQRVGPNGTVTETRTVDRGQVSLADGETVVIPRRIDPTMTGESLRLQYRLYTQPVSDDPKPANAALTLRHWIDVVEENRS